MARARFSKVWEERGGANGFVPSLTFEQTFKIIYIFLQDAYFSKFLIQLVYISLLSSRSVLSMEMRIRFKILWSLTFKHYPNAWISHHGEMRILSSNVFFIISIYLTMLVSTMNK